MRRRTTPIYGRKLAAARSARHISRQRFGNQVGLTVSGLYKIESREISQVFHDHAHQFPGALGISAAEFERDFVAGGPFATAESSRAESSGEWGAAGTFRQNSIPEIPVFELSVSAGPWSDVVDLEDADAPEPVVGPFRTFISGDSMEPLWHGGEIVEFQPADLQSLEIGGDYYIQRADGLATFKRLRKIRGERLEFQAINAGKYPAPLAVEWGQIRQIGHAVGVFQPRRTGGL